jgi:hypothetical protein
MGKQAERSARLLALYRTMARIQTARHLRSLR